MSSWSKAPPGGSDAFYSGPSSEPSHPAPSWMNEGDGHPVMTCYSNWAMQPYTSTTAPHGGFSYEHQMMTPSVSIAQHEPGVAMTTQCLSADGTPIVFGFNPVGTTCRLCNQRIVTEVSYVRGKAARFFCQFVACMGILMPLICLFCLCLIPLYAKSCQDVLHSCPQCKQPLQIVQRPLKNRTRKPCPKCC